MSTLSLWTSSDPFAEFDALVRRTFGPGANRSPGFTPAAEVTRDGDDAVISVELPGVDAERDVAVEVTGEQLSIRGERKDQYSEQRDGRSVREVRYGSFRRSFTLPKHVRADAVTASYEAGFLRIRVPGAYIQPEGARRIPVTTGGSATPVTAGGSTTEIPASDQSENGS